MEAVLVSSIPELIMKKRDGEQLSDEDIKTFVNGVTNGTTTNAQSGAMLMAMYLQGLSAQETVHLTRAMLASGDVLTWPHEWRGTLVDKHSTGGVGDKISLPLAPALAACGLRVPMISGRGLGYTGGTLDKLESIPGFRVYLDKEEIVNQLETVGCCIVGQTETLVPADKVLYAIRDTTATVDNMSLITASIISKKAAESIEALVIEITFGKAGPIKTEKEARFMADMMISLGNSLGIKTTAMLLRMDDPIGNMIGNALEVIESIRCMKGQGPPDLEDCVCQMGGQLLFNMDRASSVAKGCEMIRASLHDGSARARFTSMLIAQGVDRMDAKALFKEEADILPKTKFITHLNTDAAGFVHNIDALVCGIAAHQLGAGRTKPGESINYAVGIELTTQPGAHLKKGGVWAKIHHDSPLTTNMLNSLKGALCLNPNAPTEEQLLRVIDVLE